MVTNIKNEPISSDIVDLAVAAEMSNGIPTALTVEIDSLIVLTPTAKDYVTNNDLLPEIVSRAGLDENLELGTITESSHVQKGNHHLYTLSINVPNP